MNPSPHPYCDRQRAARLARGLSIRELGKRAGCAADTLASYEEGKAHPLLEAGGRIARALDVPAAWLLFGVHTAAAAWMVDTSAEGLGMRLRVLRELRGLSQGELARAAGLLQQTVGHYESGAQSARVDVIDELARVLAVPVELLGLWVYPTKAPVVQPELEAVLACL